MTSVLHDVTTGVTGQSFRAAVTPWGDIRQRGVGAPVWRWFVAADDRWHTPAEEAAVRQSRLEGTPVIETRVRVPGGDAVQRVWSVADHGGLTMIEFENDSARAFAIAMSGGGLLTERPPTAMPIEGIDLPADAIVLPVGHRASVRVAIPHTPRAGRRALPPGVSPPAATARGWLAVCDRASRLALPSDALVEEVVAARCALLLDGPVDSSADPLGFLFDVGHLTRLGESADAWLVEAADPLARVARYPDAAVDDALDGLERLAERAGDHRAAGDIAKVRERRASDGIGRSTQTVAASLPAVDAARSRGAFVDGVERFLVSGGELLAGGIPESWRGSNFEAHGLPTSPRSALSFALRWHGERPAVIWEQIGVAVTLSATVVDPTWTTDAVRGETLWDRQPISFS